MKKISYSRQHINKDDIEAVKKVLKSDFITQGPSTISFEDKVKKFTGAKHAVAVNSATSALHISCIALGLKKMIFYGPLPIHLWHLLIAHCIVEHKLI